jgi:hypothetical protein
MMTKQLTDGDEADCDDETVDETDGDETVDRW